MRIEQQSEVSAIIVTYNPEVAGLGTLLNAIAPQVAHIVVVDNGSKANLGQWLAEQTAKTEFAPLGSNYGIAKAQNVGIDRARTKGSDYVLLLDQDSVPAPNMVATLLAAAKAQIAGGIKLACVGPRYEDSRQNNPPPFIKIEGLRLQRQTCASAGSVVDVDYLIASGSLIPMATIEAVGGMQEELFIDYVDIEWGLRAQHKGYQSFGVCAAEMQHDLGDNPVKFRGRSIPVHSPLRHYYHFRNAVWLYRQSWPRTNWKIVDAARLVRKFVFYSLFTTPRHEHAWMMTKGIFHGLLGRMGKKPDNG
jgi:rhamnosyltransferase